MKEGGASARCGGEGTRSRSPSLPTLPSPQARAEGQDRAGSSLGWQPKRQEEPLSQGSKVDVELLRLLGAGKSPGHREGKGSRPWRGARGRRAPSRPEQLLDHVAGKAVEEQGQHEQPQQRQHDLDDEPLVAGADEVLDGLEWVEKPDEGRVRPAGDGEEGRCRSQAAPRGTCPLSFQSPRGPVTASAPEQ